MGVLNNFWRYSRLRFYILNSAWNISFWLNCEKIYKNVSYKKRIDDFHVDEIFKMTYKYETITKRRFVGYLYKGNMYFDNPGLKIDGRDVWQNWKRKGLI